MKASSPRAREQFSFKFSMIRRNFIGMPSWFTRQKIFSSPREIFFKRSYHGKRRFINTLGRNLEPILQTEGLFLLKPCHRRYQSLVRIKNTIQKNHFCLCDRLQPPENIRAWAVTRGISCLPRIDWYRLFSENIASLTALFGWLSS